MKLLVFLISPRMRIRIVWGGDRIDVPVPRTCRPFCVKSNVQSHRIPSSRVVVAPKRPMRLGPTRTDPLALAESRPSLTVSVTEYLPRSSYTCRAVAPVPVLPSPKSQLYVSASPSGSVEPRPSKRYLVSPAMPNASGVIDTTATGAVFGEGTSITPLPLPPPPEPTPSPSSSPVSVTPPIAAPAPAAAMPTAQVRKRPLNPARFPKSTTACERRHDFAEPESQRYEFRDSSAIVKLCTYEIVLTRTPRNATLTVGFWKGEFYFDARREVVLRRQTTLRNRRPLTPPA